MSGSDTSETENLTSGRGGEAAAAPPAETPDRERSSWFAGKLWFWVPLLPLVVADLWTKVWAFGYVPGNFIRIGDRREEAIRVWENGAIDFYLVAWRNTGTIWGLAKDFNSALVVLRCLALVLLAFLASRTRRREWGKQFVLGLILAGAIGNLWDNLMMEDGAVRDFLSFRFHLPFLDEPYVFPAFNVADSCICVGAITLAILLSRGDAED